jgi:hypothetical protein
MVGIGWSSKVVRYCRLVVGGSKAGIIFWAGGAKVTNSRGDNKSRHEN